MDYCRNTIYSPLWIEPTPPPPDAHYTPQVASHFLMALKGITFQINPIEPGPIPYSMISVNGSTITQDQCSTSQLLPLQWPTSSPSDKNYFLCLALCLDYKPQRACSLPPPFFFYSPKDTKECNSNLINTS